MDTYSYASTPLLKEGHTQCLWAVSGDDPEKVSASQVAQRMNIRMTQPHIVWNPNDGGLVTMMEPGREHRYLPGVRNMFAILVVATGELAFTDYPEQHLLEVFEQIPEGIPSAWPMGPPTTLNLMATGTPIADGHYSADQVNRAANPVGRLDIRKIRRQS